MSLLKSQLDCHQHIHNILNNYILITNTSKSKAFDDLTNNQDCLNFLAQKYDGNILTKTLDTIHFECQQHDKGSSTHSSSTIGKTQSSSSSTSASLGSTSTAPPTFDTKKKEKDQRKELEEWKKATELLFREAKPLEKQEESPKKSQKPTQPKVCQDYLLGYCRFENIFYHGKCPFKHEGRKNANFQYKLEKANPTEFDTTVRKFKDSFNGNVTVTNVEKITNTYLEHLYDLRRNEITKLRNGDVTAFEPLLFHGTSENALHSIMTNGIYIPSDYNPDTTCPVSGKLQISICKSDCKLCTASKHVWNNCHMYGLGAYFADKSSKSDLYVSDVNGSKHNKKGRKMFMCKVFPGKGFVIDQSLKDEKEKHDDILPPKGHDSVYAVGKGSKASSRLDVANSEYILFNPYQCLPVYLITYDK